MKVFVIADTHFDHENIIEYCDRPFDNVEEMNETMIKNWNEVVEDGDMVLHVGDFMLTYTERQKEIMCKLKGDIYLIRGNHDRQSKTKLVERLGFKDVFDEVIIQGKVGQEVKEAVLTHRPLSEEEIEERGFDYNIHGHKHNLPKISDKHKCVSVEKIDYKPLELELETPYRMGGK